MTVKFRTLRHSLLIGASVSTLIISGTALAQSRSVFGSRSGTADPAVAAARAAQDQASRAAQSNSASQRAITAFRRAADSRSAMSAAQAAARAAAQAAQSNVPNGLGQGGLQVANGVVFGPDGKPIEGSLWIGAHRPAQSAGEKGRTNVLIDQTQAKAILTWDSFNVGRETDLSFKQGGADWVALNRVTDASADPTRILGSIKAPGSVYILNRNGVIFGGASQVNVRNLIAATASITNDQFLRNGIYSTISGSNYLPSFTNAGGKVSVEAGAQITTTTPSSVTSGGGFVLLMGTEVTNAGSITTPRGQSTLSAGDDFLIRRGYGTNENQYSTTRGNEVRGQISANSASGTVTNTGMIEAVQGDITLAGRAIRQDGVLVSTTSVNQRGTIHLLNSRADGEGSVTLGKGSLTLILPELDSKDTALDSQRDALIKASTGTARNDPALGFDDRSTLTDRLDQSRVEIVTGGKVLFEGGSQTMANGGQVSVQADAGRITVADGATIDVSGTMGVALDMESNSMLVNIQGNEMRDSPANRDQNNIRSQNVWVDVRDLVLLPNGTGGYEGDRWYTKGGLLEVGGYLANTKHRIGEWTAVGGTITLSAKEVVAEKGALFDISGGSLDYQAGYVRSSLVMGADGRMYDIRNAPANIKMVAVGNAFLRKHARWGEQYSDVYSNTLFSRGTSARWEDGYTVGRDAGKLILSAPTVLFDGDIVSEVVNGDRQTITRPDGVTDGYKLSQHTAAGAGTLAIGKYDFLGRTDLYGTAIRIGDLANAAPAFDGDSAIATDRVDTAWFDASRLSAMKLGKLDLGTRGTIAIDAPLEMATGGRIDLTAPVIDIAANITARGGGIHATNLFTPVVSQGTAPLTRELELDGKASTTLRKGATLDLRGLWVNANDSGAKLSNLAWLDGGSVTLESSRDVTVEKGGAIDVSSGAALLVDGSMMGGRGGNVSLLADATQKNVSNNGLLTLDGDIRAYGVAGGGTLRVQSGPAIIIGGKGLANKGVLGAGEKAPVDLVTLEEYVVQAGEAMPIDLSYQKTVASPGEAVSGVPQFESGSGVVLLRDWQPPAYPGVGRFFSVSIWYFRPGETTMTSVRWRPARAPAPVIPTGSKIIWYDQAFPSGFVVPDGVFAGGGIPITPTTMSVKAGEIVAAPFTIPANTIVPRGTALDRAVAVTSPGKLDRRIFSTGFSAYEVNGNRGVAVGEDVKIDVAMPVYRLTANARTIASGAAPADALELWTPPLYQANPVTGILTQRQGASLALLSGGARAGGTIAISHGAAITVDPGHTIRLTGWLGRTIVDGTLNAWGGEIAIDQNYRLTTSDPANDPIAANGGDANAIWIGDHAVLDVAARAATATDQYGRTYGVVRDGGTIAIGGALDWEKSGANFASDAFVIIRPGAVLDASGTHALLDYPVRGVANGSRSVDMASNGGTIVLASNRGLFIDGTMKATAGGAGAAGGTLGIALETPIYATTGANAAVMNARELVLSQSGGSGLAADLSPGQSDPALRYGAGRIGVDQIEAGGFDNASLLVNGVLSFDGGVRLTMAQSLRLYAGAYALSDSADDAARVSLAAPYVLLANVSTAPSTNNGYVMPLVRFGAGDSNAKTPSRESDAVFAVTAGLIDLRDRVGFGVSAVARDRPANGNVTIDRRGFGEVSLTSSGDLRLLRSMDGGLQSTALITRGDISLTAAQLYPVTGASTMIAAGAIDTRGSSSSGWNPDAVLTIARTAGTNAVAPLSVFGTLTLAAPAIEQGGVVRAPLGQLNIGYNTYVLGDGIAHPGSTVRFLPGSETSISAAGITLPYGGTVDGIKYFYNGKEVLLKDASGLIKTAVLYQDINIAGLEIDVQKGAVLDLSGGGDLLGSAFVSGRGGSVDVLNTAFANVNPGYTFSDPDNQVYAIVPGYAGYAPDAPDAGAGDPAIGRQITVPDGVPGLPAGTYTLMPSTYALMDGAFRVEIGKASPTLTKVTAIDGMTYSAPGTLSTLGTSQRNALPNAVFITPAKAVRSYSGYNETSYNAFVLADAARRGVLRAPLTGDARFLNMVFDEGAGRGERAALTFEGKALFAPDAKSGGFTGGATVSMKITKPFADSELEIMAKGASPSGTAGIVGASLYADALTAIGAPSLSIEGYRSKLILRSGTTLSAGEVAVLSSNDPSTLRIGGGIVVEQGVTIDTVGKGKVSRGADDGYVRNVKTGLILSNSDLNVRLTGEAGPAIEIGTCASGACTGETRLVSEGSMALATTGSFQIADTVRYGTRNLVIATSSINFGENGAIADAGAAGARPPGLTINQTVLDTLLRGNSAINAPAVETLRLNASQSVNIYGAVTIDTGSTGASGPGRLVLGTPAIYGYGAAGDTAVIKTGEFVWAGVMDGAAAATPGAAIASRLGHGALDILAGRIAVGHGVNVTPQSTIVTDRLVAGFDALNLTASERVLFEGRNRIGVYQAQGGYVADKGFSYSGGALTITAPLVTSAAGGSTIVKSGGAIRLVAPEGAAASDHDALGGELRFAGSDVLVDTTVALHSGKLGLEASGAIDLGARSRIDLSGREIAMFDVKKYSWGGDLSLVSGAGDITQRTGSVIDLSATNNAGGALEAVALGTGAGTVDLAGSIRGAASGQYDAGGTMVPFDAAELSIEARQVTDFAGLNTRLNSGGVTGARRFHIKQGDLVVGDGVKARRVEIFTDGGSLTVNGLIDASGFQVGSIRLGGRDGLTINGTLDAHGAGVRRDSYGKVIESPNRAIIDLTASDGRISVAGGARMDLRYGTDTLADQAPLGTLTFNARRLGVNNADISVAGTPGINGAKLIAVNAFRSYDDAPLATSPDVTGNTPQIVTQAYLDAIDLDSQAFMAAALGNGNLSGRLSGLGVYHLRPGVAITSNATTNPAGNIAVMGDLDLSGYRYGPNANRSDPALRGYGEPGALVIRAGGTLSIHGSINDGFGLPVGTPDDANSWVLAAYKGWDGTGGNVTPFGQEVVVPIAGVILDAGTKFSVGVTLNYDAPMKDMTLPAGTVLPVEASLAAAISLPAGTVLAADILNPDGSIAHAAGTVLSEDITLTAGTKLGAGTRLVGATQIGAIVWPKGVALPVAMSLNEALPLAIGSVIPSMTDVKIVGGSIELRPTVDGRQGRNWAVAPMLGEGSTSWDMRLVAGADLDAVDTRMIHKGTSGNLTLADTHTAGVLEATPGSATFTDAVVNFPPGGFYLPGDPVPAGAMFYCSAYPGICSISAGSTVFKPERPLMSVVRTGTGDLDLIAAGDVRVRSLYGIYTAGVNTRSGGDDARFNQPRSRFNDGTVLGATNATLEPLLADYRAWYPDHGGNLLVNAGGAIVGDQLGDVDAPWPGVALYNSGDVGNWLWRQGTGSAVRGDGSVPTAWWINFGTYAVTNKPRNDLASVIGFTGFGALGGGNVALRAGGDVGAIDAIGSAIAPDQNMAYARSQALVVVVGSTGRVLDNGDGVTNAADLRLTGGGDIDMRLGGTWNPNASATRHVRGNAVKFGETSQLNGALVDLRGSVQLDSRGVGTIGLTYGNVFSTTARFVTDPFTATLGTPTGGIALTLGDAASYLNTRDDLVLGIAEDAGRARQYNSAGYSYDGTTYLAGGVTWFTLWTEHSAVNLFSAGGNLTPRQLNLDDVRTMDGQIVYPSILRAVAPNGSLYYGLVPETNNLLQAGALARSLLLAPSPSGALELLAGQSIYANGHSVNMSAANVALPTPLDPAFAAWETNYLGQLYTPVFSNGSAVGQNVYETGTGTSPDLGVLANSGYDFPLFAFGAPGILNGMVGKGRDPARFYAVNGDIVDFSTGEKLIFTRSRLAWYEGGGPVRIRAGRDILGLGRASDESRTIGFGEVMSAWATGSLIVHGDANDVSVISAGRDIRYANVEIAGPGALEISAGRNIVQEDRGLVTSIGPIVRGDLRPGAGISMTAGVGANGLDYSAIRNSYLDPAKLADPAFPLAHANNRGKVAKVYGKELVAWLGEHYGFTGSAEDALAYFDALPVENRNLFLRQVYYAELREGGREYNDATGPRFGSYLRGRGMIATLFPDKDAAGKAIVRTGDITMFGGSGVRTIAGGDISLLAPGGQIVLGVQGAVPPSTAGLITQGNGDISTYSKGSLLLGLSRIMTTFGGSVLGWSAEGDINAGRGAKTTIVYTPPRRTYDNYGNVTLSPLAPSSGAGIATLDPIPEVKPGDIDLIAPLGTIDAGEAGIRVSGSINLAALQVLNAANIQVKGNASGIPQAVVVNTGALTAASAASSAAVTEATRLAERSRPAPMRDIPTLVNVRFLGFGED